MVGPPLDTHDHLLIEPTFMLVAEINAERSIFNVGIDDRITSRNTIEGAVERVQEETPI